MVPNAGCRNGIRIRDAEWDQNVVHIDARFLFKIQGAYTLSNNNHIVLTVDTGYRYRIRDTECGPSIGYGIRRQDTRCEFTPKCSIESRYRIQMQDTGYRMGPKPYRCGIRIRNTGYAVCPTLSVAPGTGYRYGKQDAKLALHPLPHKNARCRCKIQDTEFAPHLPIATHAELGYGYIIRILPHSHLLRLLCNAGYDVQGTVWDPNTGF